MAAIQERQPVELDENGICRAKLMKDVDLLIKTKSGKQ